MNVLLFVVSTAFQMKLSTHFQVMPVLDLAEREVRRLQLIPNELSIKWIPYDDKCDPSYATYLLF